MVYMNDDPVYHFNLGTFISFLTLKHIKSRAASVLRRFIFLFLLWYGTVLQFAAYTLNSDFTQPKFDVLGFKAVLFSSLKYLTSFFFQTTELEALPEHILVLLCSLCYAVVHALLIAPCVFCIPDLNHGLSWNESSTKLGKQMDRKTERSFPPWKRESLKKHRNKIRSHPEEKSKEEEELDKSTLYTDIKKRLVYLSKQYFWYFLFMKCLRKRPTKGINLFLWLRSLAVAPVVLLCVPFLTLPIFTVLTGVVQISLCFVSRTSRSAVRRTKKKTWETIDDLQHVAETSSLCESLESCEKTDTEYEDKKSNSRVVDDATLQKPSIDNVKTKNYMCFLLLCPFLLTGYLLSVYVTFAFLHQTVEMLMFLAMDLFKPQRNSFRMLILFSATIIYIKHARVTGAAPHGGGEPVSLRADGQADCGSAGEDADCGGAQHCGAETKSPRELAGTRKALRHEEEMGAPPS